jgi:hypothetical protein
MISEYSTQMPDGRLLGVKVKAKIASRAALEVVLAYEIDGKEVTRAQAERAWATQPNAWQRGRTLQDAITYWLGDTRTIILQER